MQKTKLLTMQTQLPKMKNNFFITEKQKNLIAANAEEMVSVVARAKYADLHAKYGVSFSRARKENQQLLWQYSIDRQDALAPDAPWRLKLNSLNDWQNRKADTAHVLAFIEHAGFLPDYFYLNSWQTQAIEHFVNYTLVEYGIRVSMCDLLECQDFDKFFSQFLIENCDSKTLDASKRTKGAFDILLKGLNADEKTALVNLLQAYAYSDMEYSTLHKMMNV